MTTTMDGKSAAKDKAGDKPEGEDRAKSPTEAEPGSTHDDAFDQDALPAPDGATGALLRSLLAPLKGRVVLAALLLLLQQAAVQAG
ncbi:ABC transporter ATP-binding protein, partial [Streptomyces sp. T-3]|nr:ABC transporter ATP-binding protein [Streptomyces sp. T-3]